MGYRGEDASRTRADSRRQPPWQSSSGPRPAATERNDGSRGYGQEDAYAAAGDYDAYAPDDSYAGYDGYDQHAGYDHDAYSEPGGYGQDGDYGYPQGGGYAGPGSYPAQADGYGRYPAQPGGYGRSGAQPALPGGHDGPGGYPARAGGYGGSGGYPGQDDGHGGSGDPAGQGSYGGSGGYRGYGGSGSYPAQSGGYGRSGGQPALPGGHDASGGYRGQDGSGPEDIPGRYAGDDWYARPGAAPGSGFADTGTFKLDARAIDSYGTRPRPPARDEGIPPGLVHTGQQERYDGLVHTGQQERYDDQYGSYPEYERHDEYGDAGGYQAAQGYDQDYDERDDDPDPYQDRYGKHGMAPQVPGEDGKSRKKIGGAKRGKRRLVLAALAVVLVGIAAAAVYVFALKPKPAADSASSTGPLPSPGTTSAATAACVKQLGEYCHIELRTDDPQPLTLEELFPPAFTNESDHASFTRVGTKLDTTCANAVIGQDLVSALQSGKCTQVLRASYVSGNNQIMATIGVVNLATTNEAHDAGRLVGTNDFVTPLSTTKGITSKLGQGTGIVQSEYKGHYLILIWAEFTTTKAPANSAQDQQLQQFGTDLIAGTANIELSQLMVNGDPATPAG